MKIFIITASLVLVFLTDIGQATPLQQSVSTFGTAIKMSRAKFNIAIQFRLGHGAKFNKVKDLVSNNNLLKKYIPWVQSATYSPTQSNGNYQFDLTVGKYGFNYKQSFICRNSGSQMYWTQECLEQAAGSNSPVMSNAALMTQCSALNNGGVKCDFNLQGQMHDVHALFVTIPAAKVAYNFYLQYTSYAAQIGTFKGNNFHKLMKDLEIHERTAVRQSSNGTYNFVAQIPQLNNT